MKILYRISYNLAVWSLMIFSNGGFSHPLFKWQDELGRWHFSDSSSSDIAEPFEPKEKAIQPVKWIKTEPINVVKATPATKGNWGLSEHREFCIQLKERIERVERKAKKAKKHGQFAEEKSELRWQKLKSCP